MIILTGGAGFIGSCFLWKLNAEGIDDILVADQLDLSDKWRNLTGKKFSDYVQKDELLRLISSGKLKGVSHVVHMGAESSTILPDADRYITNNYEYTKTLAEWALKTGAKFIYASSAATYGAGENGYSDSDENSRRLVPLNMYGYSKQLFDMWAMKKGLLDKITGIKFFNVFGPNEYHKGEMRSLVCKAFPVIKSEGKIRLFKSYLEGYRDGEQKRDFIYVKDAVKAMFFLFSNPKVSGIFNLGTGKARSWNDLASALFSAMGRKKNIEYVEMPAEIRGKYQYFTQADMAKLRSAGYKAEFMSLEDSVMDYSGYLETNSIL
ncbi:MAG TPA: ADP-glyceromanno-heptose 6-epimerase [Candidatus Omnitrophota bacterium]|nr:ADP-glyceromanno-heptose 6-epimerase [Candidatus Omnitrophota bacterium]